ncbi:MAG: hypothetical protein DMH00_00115 [Acidobacteria bacterium]|nr:MAG: hypothetical protein DMH00_00115 [Acidobacteriota bacterium]
MHGKNRTIASAGLFILGAFLQGAVGSGPAVGVSPVKKVEVLPESDGLRPGGSMRLVIKVSLGREFHVNSHVPNAEYLIPTSVEVVALDGLQAGEWEYPEPQTKKFAFSEEPLSIYEGSFMIRGALIAPSETSPSQKQVRLALKYQACTAERCYPPKKEEVSLAVRVISRETPTKPLHPELFRSLGSPTSDAGDGC